MRRKERAVTNSQEIYKILKKCDVCRIAFFDENYPYIIPMNFGVTFEGDTFTLYVHGAKVGKKVELMEKNNNIAFEMDCSHTIVEGETACEYSMTYESVCGNGVLTPVPEAEKVAALTILLQQYTDKALSFSPERVAATGVWKVRVTEISGKHFLQ